MLRNQYLASSCPCLCPNSPVLHSHLPNNIEKNQLAIGVLLLNYFFIPVLEKIDLDMRL